MAKRACRARQQSRSGVSLWCMGMVVCCLWPGNPSRGAAALPRANLSLLTPRQWAEAFALTRLLALPQRVAVWADLAVIDSEYVADPLGEGPGQAPDPDALCDFARVDCVTYVEQVYALALSTDRAQFDDVLRRIRYLGGQIDYRWRNHYTVADWLPANAWFIKDVTAEVGAGLARPMTKTIARGKFFADKGLTEYAALPDEEVATPIIPRDRAVEVLDKLHTGDMVIFAVSTPGIVAGHVGLVRRTERAVRVQHASLAAKRVVTMPLGAYLRDLPARFVGIKIARPYEPVPAMTQP